jgi:hypothetical protein
VTEKSAGTSASFPRGPEGSRIGSINVLGNTRELAYTEVDIDIEI